MYKILPCKIYDVIYILFGSEPDKCGLSAVSMWVNPLEKALSSISRVKITLYEINILFFLIICVVSSRNFWFDVFHFQEGSH